MKLNQYMLYIELFTLFLTHIAHAITFWIHLSTQLGRLPIIIDTDGFNEYITHCNFAVIFL